MSRIRVGDIEIDGGRIVVGSLGVGRAQPPSAREPARGPTAFGRELSPRWLAGSGAALALGGLLVYLLSPPLGGLPTLVAGLMACSGAGLIALGAFLPRQRTALARAERARIVEEAAPRVLAALVDAARPLTLEEIGADWSGPMEHVLFALDHLMTAGAVAEDLDPESEDWTYSAAPPPPHRWAGPIHEQLRDLEDQR